MMSGQSEVTCCGDILTRMTRKHRNTDACTEGEVGMVRRLSASRSARGRLKYLTTTLLFPAKKTLRTLNIRHLLLVLVDFGAENDER